MWCWWLNKPTLSILFKNLTLPPITSESVSFKELALFFGVWCNHKKRSNNVAPFFMNMTKVAYLISATPFSVRSTFSNNPFSSYLSSSTQTLLRNGPPSDNPAL